MQKNDHLKTKKISALMIVLSVAYLVVACGGGSSSEPTASPTPAPTPIPTPDATPTPAPSPSATPTPSPSATVCMPAAIGASGYSLVFKACNGAVAEYYDKTECVRDNATGLIWQGQTPAGTGLRANDQYKTNFTSTTELQKNSAIVNGVVIVVAPIQAEVDAISNSVGFTNAINASNLCGSSDWRMPSKDELLSIVKASENPRIDNAWFPNTVASYAAPFTFYNTSSPYLNLVTNTWGVSFAGGGALVLGRDNGFGLGKTLIRLVR